MQKPKKRHVPRSTTPPRPGEIARSKGRTLNSYRIGALPIIDRLLQRMRLDEFLRSYLPRADRRCRIAPSIGISLLLKNVLLCREPLYGIGEWAARYAPEALGFADTQLPSLNDDRVGRCLDRLFQSDITSLVLALVTHVVREFQVDLDELHNDSTTITFHGAYADAAAGRKAGPERRGWRSPGATTRTIGLTSSNYSISSRWPGTARFRCISRSPAATWPTTRPIAPPGISSVA